MKLNQLLLIDNNDSFVYNIVDILRNIPSINNTVLASNKLLINDLIAYDYIIISPGPMKPSNFPVLNDVILFCTKFNKPLLGICLGHQALCEFFGAELVQLNSVVHGQKKLINIDNNSHIYKNLPSEIEVGLYHSWMIKHSNLPESLKITGMSSDQCLMSVQHTNNNIFGLQFHPESFMTKFGKNIIENFINIQI